MNKIKVRLLFLTIVIALCSCNSGTWEDDNENWERAFNQKPRKEIKIKHSWYWKSPHFTYEFEYFFEIEHSDTLEKAFFEPGDLIKIDSNEYKDIRFFNPKPKWFVPNDYKSYEIFKSSGFDNYYLFIDRENKSIYITDFQT